MYGGIGLFEELESIGSLIIIIIMDNPDENPLKRKAKVQLGPQQAQVNKIVVWMQNVNIPVITDHWLLNVYNILPDELRVQVMSEVLRPNFEPTSPTFGVSWQGAYPPPILRMAYAQAQLKRAVENFRQFWNHTIVVISEENKEEKRYLWRRILQGAWFRDMVYQAWLTQPLRGINNMLDPRLAWKPPTVGGRFDIPSNLRASDKVLIGTKKHRKVSDPHRILPYTWYMETVSTFFFNDYLRWATMCHLRFIRLYWNAVIAEQHKGHSGIGTPVSTDKSLWAILRGVQDLRGRVNTFAGVVNFSSGMKDNPLKTFGDVLQPFGALAPGVVDGSLFMNVEFYSTTATSSKRIRFPGHKFVMDPHIKVLVQISKAVEMIRVPTVYWLSSIDTSYIRGRRGEAAAIIYGDRRRDTYVIFDKPVYVTDFEMNHRIQVDKKASHQDTPWNFSVGFPLFNDGVTRQRIQMKNLSLGHPENLKNMLEALFVSAVMKKQILGRDYVGQIVLKLDTLKYGQRNLLPLRVTGHRQDSGGVLTLDLTERHGNLLHLLDLGGGQVNDDEGIKIILNQGKAIRKQDSAIGHVQLVNFVGTKKTVYDLSGLSSEDRIIDRIDYSAAWPRGNRHRKHKGKYAEREDAKWIMQQERQGWEAAYEAKKRAEEYEAEKRAAAIEAKKRAAAREAKKLAAAHEAKTRAEEYEAYEARKRTEAYDTQIAIVQSLQRAKEAKKRDADVEMDSELFLQQIERWAEAEKAEELAAAVQEKTELNQRQLAEWRAIEEDKKQAAAFEVAELIDEVRLQKYEEEFGEKPEMKDDDDDDTVTEDEDEDEDEDEYLGFFANSGGRFESSQQREQRLLTFHTVCAMLG